jgi:hypothetical protein
VPVPAPFGQHFQSLKPTRTKEEENVFVELMPLLKDRTLLITMPELMKN